MSLPARLVSRSFFQLLLTLAFLTVAIAPLSVSSHAGAQSPPAPAVPKVVVVTKLRNPDFVMRSSGMFSGEKKTIPLVDYDFGNAMADEVVAALAEDKRAQWRTVKPDEKLHFESFFAKDQPPAVPPSVEADRVLAINIVEFGGWSYPMHGKKFVIYAGVGYFDRASGRQLWGKGYYETIKMPESLEKSQQDSQKELKEGLNKLIEKLTEKLKKKVADSSL